MGALGVAAGIALFSENQPSSRAMAGFTNPEIPDAVYVERAKQYLGPISWHQQPDGSWAQRGGCVYVKVFHTDPVTGVRKRSIASGVLLNEWTVVTAAHLVNKKDPTISVGWSLNCLVNSPDEVPVSQTHIHPGYLKNGPANDPDVAVLILKTRAVSKENGARSGAAILGSEPIAYDTVLELCGYGKTNNDLDTGEPRAGNTQLFRMNPLMGYSPRLYESTSALYAPEPRLSGYRGDSGGPVLGRQMVTDPDGVARMRTVCVGHIVSGTVSGLGATDFLDYRVQETRSFIGAHMKTEVPNVAIHRSDDGGRITVSWPQSPYNLRLKTSNDMNRWEPLPMTVFRKLTPEGDNFVTLDALGDQPTFFTLEATVD